MKSADRPSDSLLAEVRLHLGLLEHAVRNWWARGSNSARAQAACRQSATEAVNQIDTMLSDLHRLRDRLVTEIRADDDATAARIDAFLAERRTNAADPGPAEGDAQ